MNAAAVIVAAGRGTRAGGGVPKQWRALAGRTAVAYALEAFLTHPLISQTVLVVHPEDVETKRTSPHSDTCVVVGGTTRSASVRAGLDALNGATTHVLIHDAARPCIDRSVIDGVLSALQRNVAAAPAVAVVDALWRGEDGDVTAMVDRSGLYRAQTPQGFALDDIRAAHAAFPDGADDDVALARRAGHRVAITAGSEDNIKITMPQDFDRAERILRSKNGYQTG